MTTIFNRSTLPILAIVFSAFFISACGKKDKDKKGVLPTPTPKMVEIELDRKPYISLTPRADGHEIKLKIVNIPDNITQIEYELIYLAVDGHLELEKGAGDTVKVEGSSLEKDILLGTASCTNGCKYKYDEGITGGTLSLIFINNSGQMTTHETPFTLASSSDINSQNSFSLEDLTITTKSVATGQFFILLKNFGLPNSFTTASSIYSVFASGNGAGTINSIAPDIFTKENLKSLSGDYLQN